MEKSDTDEIKSDLKNNGNQRDNDSGKLNGSADDKSNNEKIDEAAAKSEGTSRAEKESLRSSLDWQIGLLNDPCNTGPCIKPSLPPDYSPIPPTAGDKIWDATKDYLLDKLDFFTDEAKLAYEYWKIMKEEDNKNQERTERFEREMHEIRRGHEAQ